MSESYTVEAILTAVDKSFGSTMAKAGQTVQNFSEQAGKITSAIGKGLIAAGTATTALGVKSITAFGDFQAGLNKAAIVAGGTAKDIKGLSDVANKMGKDLPISANEAAQAMVAMAQNGASVGDIKKQFPAIAQAATAAGADLTTTAGVVQQAMNVWGESLKSPEQAAAILTKSANLSNASIESMQQALSTIGSTATMAGADLSTTSTAIGLLTNTGMSSAQAAQDLNHAMLQMVAPSSTAEKMMQRLGLSFVDSEGKMKPFKQILEETNEATKGLTDAQKTAALKTIFHTSGLQAMAPLLKAVSNHTDNTSVSWDAYKRSLDGVSDSTEKSTQYLNQSAEEMQKNVGSKIEQVGGSWESLRNKAMEASSGITSSLLQNIADHISWAADSNSSVAKVIRGFVGLSPIIGPATVAVGTFLTSAGKIGSVIGKSMSAVGELGKIGIVLSKAAVGSETARAALMQMSFASKAASVAQNILNASLLGCPLVWIVVAIAAVVAILMYLWNTNESFRTAIINGWNSIVSAIQPVIQIISNLLQGVFGAAMEFWKANSENIINGVKLIFLGFSTFFQGIWNIIVGIIQVVSGIITGLINAFMAVIKGDWSGAWEAIRQVADIILQGIVNIVTGVINILLGIIEVGLGAIQATWTTVWGLIGGIVPTVWNAIVAVVQGVLGFLGSLITAAVDNIKTSWNNGMTTLSTFAQVIWIAIQSFITSVITGIQNTINNTLSAIQNIWNTVWNGVSNTANSIWNGIRSFISNAISAISNIVTNTGNSMKDAFVNAMNALKNGVDSAINNVKSIFNSLIHIDLGAAGQAIMNSFLAGLKSAWGAVTSFVGGIANWIKQHKGPISYDKKLLIPAGRAIMSGFNTALQTGFSDVQNRVRGMAGSLQNEFNGNVTSSSIQSYEITQNSKPAQFTFSLGSRDFTAFVEDISNIQNKQERIRLKTSTL